MTLSEIRVLIGAAHKTVRDLRDQGLERLRAHPARWARLLPYFKGNSDAEADGSSAVGASKVLRSLWSTDEK